MLFSKRRYEAEMEASKELSHMLLDVQGTVPHPQRFSSPHPPTQPSESKRRDGLQHRDG